MLSRLKKALRSLLRRSRAERELDEELRHHIERQTEQYIRLGMNPEEARDAARKAFGGVEQAKERSRDARGVRWLEEFWQDLRYGVRMLRRKPGFTAAAVISLALGIGANSTVFTFLNAILIRPLPYPEPERLVNLWERAPGATGTNPVLPLNFVEWRDRARSFEAITLTQSFPLNAVTQEGAEQLTNLSVTSEFFRVFGVAPTLGRAFTAEETKAGGDDRGVIIISYDFWQRRFASDPGVIGKTLLFGLGQQTRPVIGVMPAGFRLPSLTPDVYTPMGLDRSNPNSIGGRSFVCYGRLKPNVDLASAQAEMSVIASQLSNQYQRIAVTALGVECQVAFPYQMLKQKTPDPGTKQGEVSHDSPPEKHIAQSVRRPRQVVLTGDERARIERGRAELDQFAVNEIADSDGCDRRLRDLGANTNINRLLFAPILVNEDRAAVAIDLACAIPHPHTYGDAISVSNEGAPI